MTECTPRPGAEIEHRHILAAVKLMGFDPNDLRAITIEAGHYAGPVVRTVNADGYHSYHPVANIIRRGE